MKKKSIKDVPDPMEIMDIPRCLSCNEPMELQAKHYRNSKTDGTKYRVRKFICELCGTSEVIHGSGERDMITEPLLAIETAKKI